MATSAIVEGNQRCTTTLGKLSSTIFHWSSNGLKLPAFRNEIKKAYLLRDPSQTEIPIAVSIEVRVVETQHYALNVMATVLVVQIQSDALER